MDFTRLSLLSEEQLDALIMKNTKIIGSKQRGKEFLDAIRQIYQMWMIRSRDVDFPAELILKLFVSLSPHLFVPHSVSMTFASVGLIGEENMSIRVKMISNYFLSKVLSRPLPVLKEKYAFYAFFFCFLLQFYFTAPLEFATNNRKIINNSNIKKSFNYFIKSSLITL